VPNTLISIPGAKIVLYEAAFVTPPILTLDDPPTVNVTGTLRYCGVPLATLTNTVALYTPFERPVADAVSVICPAPVPDAADNLSHEVTALFGDTFAVHALVPPVKLRTTLAVGDAAVKFTAAGELAAVTAAGAPPDKVVVAVNVRVLVLSNSDSHVPKLNVFDPAATLAFQQTDPCNLPNGAIVVVPKILCN
jgi:hypothetical protein